VTINYLAALTAETAGHTSTSEAVLFWILAVVAVVGAIGVVAAQKAVYSAMFLAGTMIALAVLYIAQDALFLGIVQVVVYTGAVMMLFLFVLMLIGVDLSESLVETNRGDRDRYRIRDPAHRRDRQCIGGRVHRPGAGQRRR
jgi:NADH-quinone oxidoreductase subunit J